ncbi:MAG: hypothetical protein KAJ86_07900 [Alphaproteobacteria bacterium]|nr:hypothetical protein [Alphaproteobacteria bacterium]
MWERYGGVIGAAVGALSRGMGVGYLTAKVYDNFSTVQIPTRIEGLTF